MHVNETIGRLGLNCELLMVAHLLVLGLLAWGDTHEVE